MKKFIYVRNSPNWKEIKTTEDFIKANQNSRPLLKNWLPELTKSIKNWNNTFNINYFKFRAKLKEISSTNLKEVNAKIINKVEDSKPFLLYMIDDDDLVSPKIFETIEKKLNPTDDIIIFPFGFLNHKLTITKAHEPLGDIKLAYSNNVVLTKKGYEIIKNENFLENHRKLDELIEEKKLQTNIINDTLSVYNHSPASATRMWDSAKKDIQIIEMFKKYKEPIIIPNELKWAEKYIELIQKEINKIQKIFI